MKSTHAELLNNLDHMQASIAYSVRWPVLREAENVIIQQETALAQKDAELARLKLEAQAHAQEARTANATIAEIYQVVSGATGEPGNWHGAEPVRVRLNQLQTELDRVIEGALRTMDYMRSEDAALRAGRIDDFLRSQAESIQSWRARQGKETI